MSSSKTTFTVIETVQGTFELSQEFDNVITVIGTYKSKSYTVRKLKQLSLQVQNPNETYFFEKIVGDKWVSSEHIIYELSQIKESESETEHEYHQDVISCESVFEKQAEQSDVEEMFELSKNRTTQVFAVSVHQADGAANSDAPARGSCAISADAPPTSNTGGLNIKTEEPTNASASDDDLPDFLKDSEVYEEIKNLKISETYRQLLMEGGQVKEVMLRRGLYTPAFIDTLTFTLHEDVFRRFEDSVEPDFKQHGKLVEKVRVVDGLEALSEGMAEFVKLMGLPVMGEGNGRNGYQSAILLGNKEQQRNYGFIAYGGVQQNGSVMFHLTGEGLTMARNGWELFLYAWLKRYEKVAKITRVDIAHDMLWGGYSVEQVVNDWKNDCYTVRQTRPHCEIQGTDWLSGTKKGRTVYIGSKKSSRILYFYEKGRQLGDESSEWVRVELRQRNKDYIIPLDVLLHAGDYLCSAYPHLAKVLSYDFAEQYCFERVKKSNGIAIDHVIKYAKMQVSPAIQMLKKLGLSDDEIVEKLLNEKARLPKRLILDNPNDEDQND